jgi:hypothetical protein
MAAEVEHEHAFVVAENAELWRESLDAEIERPTTQVAAHADGIEAALDRIDSLRTAREVAIETRLRRLHRLKRRRFTGQPREAPRPLRSGRLPPEPHRSPSR